MEEVRSPAVEPKMNRCLLAYPEVKNECPSFLLGIASRTFFQFGRRESLFRFYGESDLTQKLCN